ncbi:hypothetical protein [Nesterenkonia jeotgali]|uniref:Minor tail protein n=1 Tax=Nesterenkonia jeotgali TaxID=317018 RepID=A0A0W8ICT8_9MICC|nr:hypothetical protein [Nesterenkonia jeotgali]KUG57771.1 hypothetical protein AVL63_04410 [Nesterenkonia jeotgali]
MRTSGQQFWVKVPDHPYYDARDPWVEHRREAWRFDLLDLDDKLIGNLDGCESGTFDFNVNNTIRSSGAISWVQPEPGAQPPDWTQVRVQPWYMLRAPDSDEVLQEIPIGVFLPSFPSEALSATGIALDVDLHDKLMILDQDKTEEAYTARSGTLVTTLVRELLLEAGQTALSMDESTEVMRTNMTWDAGTTWLRITNDVLAAAGYFSLGVDGYGVFQAKRYVAPAQRGVQRQFLDDSDSIYDDEINHDEDIFNVPNRVIAVSTSDGETEAMVSVADDDSTGRFSIGARGRVIAENEEDVEATSQSVLDQHARRRLTEMQQVTSSYDLNHALVPLHLNDLVRLRNTQHGRDLHGVVQSFSISTEVGALQKTRIREVTL